MVWTGLRHTPVRSEPGLGPVPMKSPGSSRREWGTLAAEGEAWGASPGVMGCVDACKGRTDEQRSWKRRLGRGTQVAHAGMWGGEATGLDLASSLSMALALPLQDLIEGRTSHKQLREHPTSVQASPAPFPEPGLSPPQAAVLPCPPCSEQGSCTSVRKVVKGNYPCQTTHLQPSISFW